MLFIIVVLISMYEYLLLQIISIFYVMEYCYFHDHDDHDHNYYIPYVFHIYSILLIYKSFSDGALSPATKRLWAFTQTSWAPSHKGCQKTIVGYLILPDSWLIVNDSEH